MGNSQNYGPFSAIDCITAPNMKEHQSGTPILGTTQLYKEYVGSTFPYSLLRTSKASTAMLKARRPLI